MILRINASSQGRVTVELVYKDKVVSLSEDNKLGSQVLLPLIHKILRQQNIQLKDLSAIEVSQGPGSFTGLRIGAAVGNALGLALNIPVNGKKVEVELRY